MEDVATETHSGWSQKHFWEVSRHLGLFNGQYLCGQAIPSESWLSRDWLRGWTEMSEPLIPQLPMAAAHPVAGRIFTAEINKDLLWLWDQRHKLYSALEHLPKALCPRNAGIPGKSCGSLGRSRVGLRRRLYRGVSRGWLVNR
jgi:hypothetical protein